MLTTHDEALELLSAKAQTQAAMASLLGTLLKHAEGDRIQSATLTVACDYDAEEGNAQAIVVLMINGQQIMEMTL